MVAGGTMTNQEALDKLREHCTYTFIAPNGTTHEIETCSEILNNLQELLDKIESINRDIDRFEQDLFFIEIEYLYTKKGKETMEDIKKFVKKVRALNEPR